MREVMVQKPNVGWDDIGGLDSARDRLREGVELPLKHPEAFRRLGIRPAKGFLLYGPPGTGKSTLLQSLLLVRQLAEKGSRTDQVRAVECCWLAWHCAPRNFRPGICI